jgi:transcriptional regulator with XRE-family HTH domain
MIMASVLSRFGQYCRELRTKKNLTMGEQAHAFGCSVHEISEIECGLKTPPDTFLESFKRWMDLTPQEFADLKRRVRPNVVELHRTKSVGNNGKSIRLFRKISNMAPSEIRSLKKPPPESETNDDRRL